MKEPPYPRRRLRHPSGVSPGSESQAANRDTATSAVNCLSPAQDLPSLKLTAGSSQKAYANGTTGPGELPC